MFYTITVIFERSNCIDTYDGVVKNGYYMHMILVYFNGIGVPTTMMERMWIPTWMDYLGSQIMWVCHCLLNLWQSLESGMCLGIAYILKYRKVLRGT